jgi:predicted PurR-regulated permease PerM
MNDARFERPPAEDEGGWLTRGRLLVLVLIAVTALAFLLCYLFLEPFIPVLAWALALAIVARPVHAAIAARIRNADVAAGLAVGLVALLIFLPALFVLSQLVQETAAGAQRIQAETREGQLLERTEGLPGVGPLVHWFRDNVDTGSALQQLVAALTSSASHLVAGTIWSVVQVLLILFTLYFFFRDRDTALGTLRSVMPLSDRETDQVFARVADTIHATLYGNLVVALIQGTLGGLIFWWLGLPAPLLWGTVMAVLAVVPNLGAFVIWVPAALFMALDGQVGRALILAAWGAIAIGLIDNLLYPYLVGQRMRLHTLAVFYAILGGVLLLGASGVVLGPVILAVTLALVDVWRRRTAGGRPAEAAVRSDRLVTAGHE